MSEYKRVATESQILPQEAMQISSSISEIVSSLQFHDIVRQQIEHVAEALEDSVNRIPEYFTDENEDIIIDHFLHISDVCEIQMAQLEHSNLQVTEAVEKVIENLKGISIFIQSLYANIVRIASGSKKGDESFIAVIKKDLLNLIENLKKNKEIAEELTNSIKEVVDTVSVLGKYVEEINETGDEIELIALNARVKAAHTGLSGAVLDVLAEAIQRLSFDSKDLINGISIKLSSISETSELLKNNSEKIFVLEEGSFMTETSEDITRIINNLNKIDNKIWENFELIGKSVDELKVSIKGEVGNIKVQKKINSELSQFVMLLKDIVKMISQNVESDKARPNKITDHLHKLYSMESERKIHKTFVDKKSFTIGNQNKRINDKKKKEDDFGDNVELF